MSKCGFGRRRRHIRSDARGGPIGARETPGRSGVVPNGSQSHRFFVNLAGAAVIYRGMVRTVPVIILFAMGAGAAKTAKPGVGTVEKVLTHLRTGSGFHSKLVKRVHSGQLGSDSESDGEIYFSKGKM